MLTLFLALAFALPVPSLDAVRDTIPDAARPTLRVAPIVIRYRSGAKALEFVGARHGDAGTIERITEVFADFRPEFVVIEGVANSLGLDPLKLDPADKEAVRASKREPRWTALLAMEAGLHYVGGEPSHTEALAAVVADPRFSRTDVLSMDVVRMIPQWRRQGVSADELPAKVEERRAQLARLHSLPLDDVPSWAAVQAWFLEGNGEPLTFDMPVSSMGLGSHDHELRTKRISHTQGRVRNRRLAQTIADALTEHDRVLVVYGASHYLAMAPFLDELLGEPVEVAVRRELLYPVVED